MGAVASLEIMSEGFDQTKTGIVDNSHNVCNLRKTPDPEIEGFLCLIDGDI